MDAQEQCYKAVKAVADTVRSTLGPQGMDKVLIDQANQVTITNDGATILKEIAVEHPISQMIIDVAKTQESQVGDGTTTVVLLAEAILRFAQKKDQHPVKTIEEIQEATKAVLIHLDSMKKPTVNILQVIQTALAGKHVDETIAQLCIDAFEKAKSKSAIQIVPNIGTTKHELFEGLVLERLVVHSQMQKTRQIVKVALYSCPIEENEESFVESCKAQVIFCQKGISEYAQDLLAKKGISAYRRVPKSQMILLEQLSGAKISFTVDATLGTVSTSQKRFGEREFTCIEGTLQSLIIGGATEHIVEETIRAVDDALGDLHALNIENAVVPGAGKTEKLLALNAKSDILRSALLEIPRILEQNAGKPCEDVVYDPYAVKKKAIEHASQVACAILRIDQILLSNYSSKATNL